MPADPPTTAPKHRELSVEELLRRVRPMPHPEEFVIEDLTREEGEGRRQDEAVPRSPSAARGIETAASATATSIGCRLTLGR